jgi:hypothetical protein
MDAGNLERQIAAADAVIQLVRENPPVGAIRGDTAAGVMYGAYVKAFRRYVRIRELAAQAAGEESMILARTLLSMIARAIWIDQSPDPAERARRFQSWKLRDLQDQLADVESLITAGFTVEGEAATDAGRQELREGIARIRAADSMPNDRELLQRLKMDSYYARLYRQGSSHVHFGLDAALDEITRSIQTGQDLPLERGNVALSEEALALANLTYGLFLDMAERTVQHGLTQRVAEAVEGAFDRR